jgi:hypothetical protein
LPKALPAVRVVAEFSAKSIQQEVTHVDTANTIVASASASSGSHDDTA